MTAEAPHELEFAPTDIAIVGMAGRFPGARDVAAFWDLVAGGKHAFSTLTTEQLAAAGVSDELRTHPDYVPVGGVLEDVEAFDAAFFDVGPRDAALMDPQHRHFLECCWQALEDAGHPPSRFNGAVGVFAGSGMNGYMVHNLLKNEELVDSLGMFVVRHTSNDKDFLSTGVSYRLNLRGPSINVQTACSTSLVAVHLASQALIAGECDMALAGGVTIEVPHGQGYLYREGEILARDGVCRAFDVASSGTVLTSGAGAVVLRRLSDAVADRDHIYAVIKGTAVNNDGAGKVGFLAPSIDGHAAVVAEAQELAGINPRSIGYIEAHGTGTPVGDPIEIAALTQAFRRSTGDTAFCRIGSTKPNVGHLDTAAGVASLMKTSLALAHRVLPPMANLTGPNPLMQLDGTPFVLSDRAEPWPGDLGPRRAGVSSLGVGGTNAHVVLEEAPRLPETPIAGRPVVLALSARSEPALERAKAALAGHLASHPGLNIADVAFTLANGREEFEFRAAVAAASAEDAAAALSSVRNSEASERPSLVFMFPGGGAQYPNMGRELYEREPAFRLAFDRCMAALEPALASAVRELVFPPGGYEESAAEQLAMPTVQLPAIFSIEYALATLWREWGFEPAAMTGHSLGEYVAACLSGVFSLTDALRIVALRGRLMERVPDAAMLSVALPPPRLKQMIKDDVSLAAVNAPELCVVSGARAAIERLESELGEREIAGRRLKISGAVHCSLLDPYLDEFARGLETVTFSAPRIPYISNVTGNWVRDEDATSPAYWVKHLRETVWFADGLETLLRDPNRVLIEVGPGTTLTSLARLQPVKPVAAIPSLPHPGDNATSDVFIRDAVGKAWAAGSLTRWERVLEPGGRRVSLPTYSFERAKHWIAPVRGTDRAAEVRREAPEQWQSAYAWLRTSETSDDMGNLAAEHRWLVFVDDTGLGGAVATDLARRGAEVVRCVIGGSEAPFVRLSAHEYQVHPSSPECFGQLVTQLDKDGLLPDRIFHFGGVPNPSVARRAAPDRLKVTMERGYFGMVELFRAWAARGESGEVKVIAVTAGGARVTPAEDVLPELAMLESLGRTASREVPGFSFRAIDVPAEPSRSLMARIRAGAKRDWARRLAPRLVAEACRTDEVPVAIRDGARWESHLSPAPTRLPEALPLREGSCILITGATGRLGSMLARELASVPGISLALTGRSAVKLDDLASDLSARGARVYARAADIADGRQVVEMVREASTTLGAITGVIHAAGLVEDAPLQLKSRADIDHVLAPKVQGCLALEAAIDFSRLDFAVLFSSVSARLGPAGQADYAAANAFVSAFAEHRQALGDRHTVAVEWGIWKESGAAADRASLRGNHPGGDVVLHTADETWSELEVSPSDWLLDEHRTANGVCVMPGSGLVELMLGALVREGVAVPALKGIEFLRPLAVAGPTPVQVRIHKSASSSTVTVVRQVQSGQWVEVASATVASHWPAPPATPMDVSFNNFPALRAAEQSLWLRFGPRWSCLRATEYDTITAHALIELDEVFRGDLEQCVAHPALLDMATGFALGLLPEEQRVQGVYVPLGYGAIDLFEHLPAKFTARATLAQRSDDGSTVTFDFAFQSEDGGRLAAISGLTYRRVGDLAALEAALEPRETPAGRLVSLGRRLGIENAEGLTQLAAILSSANVPRVVVSPLPLAALESAAAADAAGGVNHEVAVERPVTAGQFVAPRDDVEAGLAKIWASALGITSIGVDDDFFDLGGNSLIALRVFATIKQTFRVDFGLSTLFGAPTVGNLAAIIRGEALSDFAVGSAAADGTAKPWPCLVPIKPTGTRTPLFCVHGAKGNVLNFRELGRLLPEDQPFFGLQLQGLNGVDPFHETLAEMAGHYVDEIRTVQPSGPYLLGGFSGGGLVALEMARILREQGEPVAAVLLFDSPAPGYDRMRSFPWFQLRNVESVFQYGFPYLWEKVRGRWYWWNWGRGRVSGIDFNHFGSVLEGHRATRFDGEAHLFRVKTRVYPRDLGWNKWISGGVATHDVSGSHEGMWRYPHVIRLAQMVATTLESVRPETFAGF